MSGAAAHRGSDIEFLDRRARDSRPVRPVEPGRRETPRQEPAPAPRERWDPVVLPHEARRVSIDPAEDKARRLR